MTKRPHVALIVETSIHYGRQILRGVTRYLHSHRAWSVFLEQRELWTAPPDWLRRWRGDGVICRKTRPELAEMLRKAGVPLVDLHDCCAPVGAPRIESDHRAIGRVAADHLMERGFRNISYPVPPWQQISIQKSGFSLQRPRQTRILSIVRRPSRWWVEPVTL